MAPSLRIISLLPAATEIVCELGLGDALIGRSHECDHPEWIVDRPVVSRSSIDPTTSSRSIHEQVSALRTVDALAALSVFEIDAESLRALRPDVIITQNQCEVCAVSEADVSAVVKGIVGVEPRIVSLSPTTVEGVVATIEQVGGVCGVLDRAEMMMQMLRDRIEAIADVALGVIDSPRVACIEWIDPLMVAGNWTPQLIELAGGTDPLGVPGEHSPWCTLEKMADADPDMIVIAPCGFGIEQTRRDLPTLATDARWANLRAVRDGQVYLADGHHYFNRPGPRLVDTLEILAEILHPDHFDFGRHERGAWERM